MIFDETGDLVVVRSAPPIWGELDHHEAETALGELSEWVEWLVVRYRVETHIPACWTSHPAMIEELAALHAAWLEAYDDHALGSAALGWHQAFTLALGRYKDAWRVGCGITGHKTPAGDPWPIETVGAD